MEKPSVIVWSTSYAPFVGGAEIAIEETAKRLSGEFDFFIITGRFDRALPRIEKRPEGTVIRIGFGNRWDKWLLPLFGPFAAAGKMREIRKGSPGKAGFLSWGIDISQAALGAALFKGYFSDVPFVFTVQYGESEEKLMRGRGGLIRRAFRIMLRRADSVTVISSYLSSIVRRHGYKGNIFPIPNGVSFERFGKERRKEKKDGNTVITASRLVHKNGVDILIRAIAEVKKKITPIRCIIAGDGPDRKKLEALTASLALEDEIEFLGNISHDELALLLNKADVFVRASRSEGMGNAFVEALAAAVPIIGTPVGGIPDIIKDGKTGLFAKENDADDLGEKIAALLLDPAYARTLAEEGRAHIGKDFSWDRIAESYRKVFTDASMPKKGILIATGVFPPEIGGPATYSQALLDELGAYGFDVDVFPFREVRHLPKVIRHFAYFLGVLRKGRRKDILFAQDPVSVGIPTMCAARILRKKGIMKIVGDYAWEQGVGRFGVNDLLDEFLEKKYGARAEFLKKCERWSARQADKIITPSEYLKKVVTRWGIDAEKINVIANSFDPPEYAIGKNEARNELGIEGFALIAVGRLVPWKGFSLLIECMGDLAAKIPNIRLVIIGSGPEERALKESARVHGTESLVSFLGNMPHERVLAYMRAGDAFVLPTGYEGFSHALLEAMALEIPIITTSAGGNPELVENGKSGILAEYGSKEGLIRAVSDLFSMDEDERLRMVREARKKANSFSKKRMMEETARFLEGI